MIDCWLFEIETFRSPCDFSSFNFWILNMLYLLMYFLNMNRQLRIDKIKYVKKISKDAEGGYISRKVIKMNMKKQVFP